MPVAILITQGVLGSLFALMFLFVPSINTSYWMLTALTTQILVLMYILVFAAALRLRYTQPNAHRPYKVPGGKVGIWIVAGMGLAGSVFGLIIGFIPPTGDQALADAGLHRGDVRSDRDLLGAAVHHREDQEAELEHRPPRTTFSSISMRTRPLSRSRTKRLHCWQLASQGSPNGKPAEKERWSEMDLLRSFPVLLVDDESTTTRPLGAPPARSSITCVPTACR